MRAPSRDTCDRENRREQLFRDSKHSIYETAVKVYVCADIFEKSSLFHDQSSGKAFYEFIEGKFLHHALLHCEVFGEAFQDDFTWVRKGINGMSHTVDQTAVVEDFFVEDLAEIAFHFFLIGPVFDVCLDILEHVLDFEVCTTMTRSLEGTDGCCNGRIGVCS